MNLELHIQQNRTPQHAKLFHNKSIRDSRKKDPNIL